MKIGFSFSPGGFLFTYHLGVLEALAEHGYINEETPLAGSSAGALAIRIRPCSCSYIVATLHCRYIVATLKLH